MIKKNCTFFKELICLGGRKLTRIVQTHLKIFDTKSEKGAHMSYINQTIT